MRRLIITLSVGLMAAIAEVAPAQEPPAQDRDGQVSELSYRPPRPRVRRVRTEADILIHQRSVVLAQHRIARIEARKWLGVSAVRPHLVAKHPVDLIDVKAALVIGPSPWYSGPYWYGW